MALDLGKYRALFLEDATEHLAQMSQALLALERDTRDVGAIDQLFRMAHSIKGMAASLDYDGIASLSHRLEDRMQDVRDRGATLGPEGLGLFFRGLAGLEAMVAVVRDGGAPPPADAELMQALERPLTEGEKKKT